jgi:hypothetical protein
MVGADGHSMEAAAAPSRLLGVSTAQPDVGRRQRPAPVQPTHRRGRGSTRTDGANGEQFRLYVMGQTMGKFSVISVHLWLEHLLALCLRVVVPDPDPLFRDRGLTFLVLVSLCEAHQVVDAPLADVLRRVIALRNKCAHQLTFNPMAPDWNAIGLSIDAIAPGRVGDDDDSLRRLAELVQGRAIVIGAIQRSTA